MKTVSLKGSPRESSGTKAANDLRKEDLVPGVIYGGGDTIHFSIPKNELNPIIYTGEFFKVDIEVDGKSYSTITKDIQFDPVTDDVIHIDFQELVKGKKVKTSIPIHLDGKPAGVTEGGILQHKLLRLNVRVKPENMVEHLSLDVTNLNLGDSLKVKSLDAGDIEVLDSPNIPIASVISPRSLRSAKSTIAAETTVIGEEDEDAEGIEDVEEVEGGAEEAEDSAEA